MAVICSLQDLLVCSLSVFVDGISISVTIVVISQGIEDTGVLEYYLSGQTIVVMNPL